MDGWIECSNPIIMCNVKREFITGLCSSSQLYRAFEPISAHFGFTTHSFDALIHSQRSHQPYFQQGEARSCFQ